MAGAVRIVDVRIVAGSLALERSIFKSLGAVGIVSGLLATRQPTNEEADAHEMAYLWLKSSGDDAGAGIFLSVQDLKDGVDLWKQAKAKRWG